MGWFLLGRGSAEPGAADCATPLLAEIVSAFGHQCENRRGSSRRDGDADRGEPGSAPAQPSVRHHAAANVDSPDMAGEKTRGAPQKQAKKPKAPPTGKAPPIGRA